MKLKNNLKPSAFLPAIIGIIIGVVLFWLGEIDDAPGLCLIGVTTAFLSMLWSGCNTGFLKKSQLAHIMLLCVGTGVFVMSIVLRLDGEFEESPFVFYIGLLLGVILICLGIMKWIKYTHTK